MGVARAKQSEDSMRLLLVEDSPEFASLLVRHLELAKSSWIVETVATLQAGLDAIKKGGVDLVLLDLNLPDSHGLDTLRVIRAASQQTPLIVLSGLTGLDLEEQAVREGADDYLPKGEATFADVVRSALKAVARRHRAIAPASDPGFARMIKQLEEVEAQADQFRQAVQEADQQGAQA